MNFKVPVCLVLLSFVGCSGLRIDRLFRSSANDWTSFGGSTSRTNVAPTSLKPPLEEAWEYNALAGITSTPLVRDSMVMITTLNGELQVVNIINGKRLGYVVMESAIAGTPALDGVSAIVPVAGGNETLVSLTLHNSQQNWKVAVGPIESSPLLSGGFVYVTTMEGRVFCLDKQDGKEIWRFNSGTDERRKPIRSSPATDGISIFFGGDDGVVYALDSGTGTPRWKFNAGAPVFATPVVAGQSVLVGTRGGTFYSIDNGSGQVRWKVDLGSPVFGTAAATERTVFVGSSDGNCQALDLATGSRTWKFAMRSVVNSAPLIAGDVLYWGSMDRTLYALDAQSGKELWKYHARGRIKVSPVLWNNLLLVTSEDKFVVALKPPS
jgi:outer membrane protein assembly factor BamB